MIRSVFIMTGDLAETGDPRSESPRTTLAGQATAEVLRACFHAAQVTLVPALPSVLAMAAVIARSRRGSEPDGDAEKESRVPRFVPYHAGGAPLLASGWLREGDLGGPARGTRPMTALSVGDALALAPEVVVALSPPPPGSDIVSLFRQHDRRPRLLYFPSLVGESVYGLAEGLGLELADGDNLEERWTERRESDKDPETGRSDDEGLDEPFIPFGVLLQIALSADDEDKDKRYLLDR